jgi:hypothetical protein
VRSYGDALAWFLLGFVLMRNIQPWNVVGPRYLALAAIMLGVSGCAVIGDIFKAGVWVAIVGIGVLALIGFGVMSLFKKR